MAEPSSSRALVSAPTSITSKNPIDERAFSIPSRDDTDDLQDEALERRLRLKVDLRLCTIAGILCSLNLLDSGVISSASVTSMLSDLDLTGNRFSVSIFIFTIASIAFQLPSTIAVRTFGPRIWFSFITISFGIITMCTAFIQTWKEMTLRNFTVSLNVDFLMTQHKARPRDDPADEPPSAVSMSTYNSPSIIQFYFTNGPPVIGNAGGEDGPDNGGDSRRESHINIRDGRIQRDEGTSTSQPGRQHTNDGTSSSQQGSSQRESSGPRNGAPQRPNDTNVAANGATMPHDINRIAAALLEAVRTGANPSQELRQAISDAFRELDRDKRTENRPHGGTGDGIDAGRKAPKPAANVRLVSTPSGFIIAPTTNDNPTEQPRTSVTNSLTTGLAAAYGAVRSVQRGQGLDGRHDNANNDDQGGENQGGGAAEEEDLYRATPEAERRARQERYGGAAGRRVHQQSGNESNEDVPRRAPSLLGDHRGEGQPNDDSGDEGTHDASEILQSAYGPLHRDKATGKLVDDNGWPYETIGETKGESKLDQYFKPDIPPDFPVEDDKRVTRNKLKEYIEKRASQTPAPNPTAPTDQTSRPANTRASVASRQETKQKQPRATRTGSIPTFPGLLQDQENTYPPTQPGSRPNRPQSVHYPKMVEKKTRAHSKDNNGTSKRADRPIPPGLNSPLSSDDERARLESIARRNPDEPSERRLSEDGEVQQPPKRRLKSVAEEEDEDYEEMEESPKKKPKGGKRAHRLGFAFPRKKEL